MIMYMMETIYDFVEYAVRALYRFARHLFWFVVYTILVLTCPVWLIPFTVIRKLGERRKHGNR